MLISSTAYPPHSAHLARIRAAGVGALVGIDWLYVARIVMIVRIIEGAEYTIVEFMEAE